MHILVPTGIFHPEPGGPASYLYHFLPELLARGHTVEVITFSDEPPAEAYPYPVQRIPRTNILHRNWRYYRAVRARLNAADGVFVNSLGLSLPRLRQPSVMKIVGDRAWERCRNRGWIPQDEDIDTFQTRRYGPLVEWVKRARTHEALAMDHIIVPSAYLKRMVGGWGVPAERIRVIYNAFAVAEPAIPLSEDERRALGIPAPAPLLVMAARLAPWKGGEHLLKALNHLPGVHLIIAGDGPMRHAWQGLAAQLTISDRVHFLGQVPQAQLLRYVASADYLVLYSGYEGLSHVVLEALAQGTPVIASDKGGNPEVIRQGENGWLVPYPDAGALVRTLKTALFESEPLHPHLDTARFTWETMTTQTIALLEKHFAP
ncbi:MAG: glycosyltransferase family 4 protein [Anaerolineales bacterium]